MSNSINRRAFIGLVSTTALSGCLGYRVQKTEVDNRQKRQLTERKTEVSNLKSQLESSETTVQNLQSRVESLEKDKSRLKNRRAQLNSKVGSLETEVSSLENELSDAESDLETAKIDHVVAIYSAGDEARRFGNGAWSSGVDAWETKNYASATGYFGRAYADYSRSHDLFEKADQQANRYDLDDGGLLLEAINRLYALGETAYDMENAAYYAASGDVSTAESYQERAGVHYNKIANYGVADVSEIENQLENSSST